jgi:hypothetical protein
MSGFKRSIIGLIVLALLGGYYYFYEVRYQGKKAKEKEISEKIFPVKKSDVTKVVYKNGKTTIVFEKKDEMWVITAPVKTPADGKTFNSFIKTFAGLKSFRKLTDVKWDDPDFGLAKTPVRVTLYDKNEKAYTAVFGNSNPTNSYFYTLKGKQKTVLLVWVYPKKLLKETLFDFRFKKVYPLKPAQVVKIHFEKGGNKVDLKRVKNHLWEIISPFKAKGDRYAIEGFISTAADENVIRFLDNPPQKSEEFGWDHPQMRIEFSLKSGPGIGNKKGKTEAESQGETVTILVGKARDKDHVYVKVAGQPGVMIVNNRYLKELDKKVFDFRDKNVWDYEIDNVRRVRYEDRKNHLVIEVKKFPEEDVWKLVQPKKLLADSRAVENWLWDLSSFRVKEFLTPEEFTAMAGTSPSPAYLFEIGVKGKKKPLKLNLFHLKDKWISQGSEPDWYYVLDSKDVEKAFKTVFDLKYRRLVKFDDTDVMRVEIKTRKKHYVFEKRKKLWYTKIGEKEKKIPNIDVLNLLWELSDLKYTELLKKIPDKSKLSSKAEFKLFDEKGKSLGDLTFSEAKSGLFFICTVEGEKEVFKIDRSHTKKFEKAYLKLMQEQKKKEK